MKYLLVLFGLSSILASDNLKDLFLEDLKELKTFFAEETEYQGKMSPIWSKFYSLCLDNLINDYIKFGYEKAVENFENNPIDHNKEHSCKYWTYSGQLHDKIKETHNKHKHLPKHHSGGK